MRIEIDHLAVAGGTLAEAETHLGQSLGVPLQPGGAHDVFHTHNVLLGLEDGLYMEAIAVNPEAPNPTRARWFDLDRFSGPPRLGNWICRCDDLDAVLDSLPEGFGQPVTLQRGDFTWRMAVPDSGILPFDNCAPALMQWDGDAHPAARLDPSGCRLTGLEVWHPEAEALAVLMMPLLRDARVRFHSGAARLEASFDTPAGARLLR